MLATRKVVSEKEEIAIVKAGVEPFFFYKITDYKGNVFRVEPNRLIGVGGGIRDGAWCTLIKVGGLGTIRMSKDLDCDKLLKRLTRI